MGIGDDGRCIFPLTSLQIGDLKSYLSDLGFFVLLESKKLYILVDNRPWLRDLGSGAHFWQLMVTKSRSSPFAKLKARRERKEAQDVSPRSEISNPNSGTRWFSFISSVTFSNRKVLLPVKNLRKTFLLRSELHRILHGFIVFEVAQSNVRGLNYLNELQTDTSLAIEAKCMQRWEFDSIAQAASSISSWFSGSLSEQLLLKDYLDSAAGEVFYNAEEDFQGTIPIDDDKNICAENLVIKDDPLDCSGGSFNTYSGTVENGTSNPAHTPPPPTGPHKRRRVTKSIGPGVEVDICSEGQSETDDSLTISETEAETPALDCENTIETMQYKDVLLLFRFNDRDLPLMLRQVIMSDLRLLTLLEAGLPSWVIFLQSYPVLCRLYRPWMCPLARALYGLVSVITVLIGFYDLYKNIPVLKATASSLCGPLFDWVENWDMASRIKYLGTMLFLHNFEKAVTWLLSIMHNTRSFLSFITQPLLMGPLAELFGELLPIRTAFFQVVGSLFSVIWIVVKSFCSLISYLAETLVLPLWFIFSTLHKIAISILYPILLIVWEILYAPVQIVLALASFLASICRCICDTVRDISRFLGGIFKVASASKATVSTYEVSMWRSLWNDLFSQVFRALKSILMGLVAFFTACNRHRLSIYNHIQKFLGRSLHQTRGSETAKSKDHARIWWKKDPSQEKKKVHVK